MIMADSGETSLVDLAKSMNKLNALFEGVTSWSRLTGACCAVVLDQEEKTPEEEDFHKKKIEVVRFLQLFVLFYFQNSKKLFYRSFLSNVSHCSHYYAEACNEFAVLNFAPLRPGNSAPFE